MYQSIVVGTDGSPTAERAVGQAAKLASALGARVHVVSAYRPPGATHVRGREDAPEMRAVKPAPDDEVNTILAHAEAVFRSEGVEAECHARRGDPADVLLTAAEDHDADLIVVGNRGMSGAKRFLLGSVPDKISHHASCSVMILHTTG
jgi:nucleotide-binding universal stress UspA family protein